MKIRLLSLLLTLVMLAGLLPTAALGVSAAEPAADTEQEEYFAFCSGYVPPRGNTMTGKNRAGTYDLTIDYCSVLGISQATADKFAQQVRESLRNYDFDVEISGVKINVNDTKREEDAMFALIDNEIFCAYDTFMFDGYSFTYYRDKNNYVTRLTLETSYLAYDYNEYCSNYNAVRTVAEHLLEGIVDNKNLSDLKKALLLHDRLAAWARYDYDNQQADTCPADSYSMVGILWEQVGVCQGYAETYAYLLDRCGIPNRFAQSDVLDHIWNIVTIDGKEYYVDVTWDDPSKYDLYGQVEHDNFLVSLSKLRQNHNAYDYVTIPQVNTYDDAFWTDSRTEFQLVDGDIYYMDNVVETNGRYATLCRWDSNGRQALLNYNDDDAMKWTQYDDTYYTSRNWVCLDSWEGKLYANGAKSIYVYDPDTAKWEICFTADSYSNRSLYGFTIWAGRFYLNYMDTWPTSDYEADASRYIHDLKEIVSIEVAKKPTQHVFKLNSIYDFRGLTIRINYADGSSSLVKNWLHGWSGQGSNTTGSKTFEITLFKQTATLNLRVVKGLSTPKVSVKNVDKGITVSWDKVTYADEYVLYRSYYSGGKWSDWTRVTTTTKTSYTNQSAKDGKVYRYAVYAWQGELRSNLGKSSSIRRLDTPTAKVANASSGAYVSWNKVTGAKNYLVYRSTYKNGKWTDWTRVATVTGTTYTDKKASANVKYKYLVKAANGSHKSAGSTSVSIRRLTASTVTAKKSGSTIKLSWTAVKGVKYYAVYRRVAGSSKWVKLYTTKTRAYVDKTAKKGTYYEYAVRAVSSDSYMSAYKACKKVKR